MSEIKDAITYFEGAIKETDDIVGDSEFVISADLKAELIEQKKHFEVALAVLQEKGEPLEMILGLKGKADCAEYLIQWALDPEKLTGLSEADLKILYTGKEYIRSLLAEPRQLTLNELWQMDGQPVYIEFLDADCDGEWGIVSCLQEGVALSYGIVQVETHGKVWAACDRPPGDSEIRAGADSDNLGGHDWRSGQATVELVKNHIPGGEER